MADLTVVTQSDDFLLEISQALGGLAAVRPVDSLDAALEGLAARRRAQLLAIDAFDLDAASQAADAAAAHAPGAIVLIFAPEGERARFAAALRGSTIFALLTKPIEARAAHAVFEGAIAEALARTSPREPPRPVASEIAPIARAPSPPEPPRTGRTHARRWLAAAAAGIAALAAGAYWTLLREPPAGAPRRPAAAVVNPPAAASPSVDLSIVQGRVDDLLEKARAAMRARRYTDPPGDNALLYYRSAAAADPSSGEARDGLQRVAGVLGERFQAALAANQSNDAAVALANLRAAAPDYPQIGTFAAQLAALQSAAQRAALARRQADENAQRLQGLVEDRIRAGRLVDGPDSAKSYAEELQRTAPANPATAVALHALMTAELGAARDAALAGRTADEQRLLAEARRTGAGAADLAAFKRAVADARAKTAASDAERLAQLASARLGTGHLTSPPQDNAVYYVDAIGARDPGYAGLGPLRRQLADALLARASEAAVAGRADEPDLAAALGFGEDPQAVLAVRARSSASTPAADGQQAAPLASRLRLVRNYAPEYPAGALENGVGGKVVVGYTVDAHGRPRDVHVVQASPPGTFDAAAMNAVSRWRYAPVIVDGKPAAVPAKILIRFDPTK